MRIVVAPQEFKGSLTAIEAAHAMALGVRDSVPDAEVVEAPMSDGGPGLVDAMLTANGGQRLTASVADPLMRPVNAAFALLPDVTAVIEMAAASGLVLLQPHERDPLVTTTLGTGELIATALGHDPREIILGVGGSATVDGGAGAIRALGVLLLDAHGKELPPGGAPLADLARLDTSHLDERLKATRVRIACDVTNPLVGAEGAASVFGPQKGASADGVRVLDAALLHFADVLVRATGVKTADLPGAGAAGGLPAALVAVAGATIEPGFNLVAEATGLDNRIAAADIVLTGEGRLDSQTAFGKTAAGVARLARAHGKPIGIIAGHVDAAYADIGAFDALETLETAGTTIAETMSRARELARAAAARIIERLVQPRGR